LRAVSTSGLGKRPGEGNLGAGSPIFCLLAFCSIFENCKDYLFDCQTYFKGIRQVIL
jgi:hypothetical protein